MPEKEDDLIIDFREVGATGLRRFSGFIYDEFLKELTGWKAIQVYKEMSRNDSSASAALGLIKNICRRVSWRTNPASSNPRDTDAADFLETAMNDMSMTWTDTINENLSMLEYGYSPHEIVYKRRCGDVFDPSMRSKYADGRIGWRKLPIRAQETIYRWQFDDHGGIQGVEQLAPPHYYHVTIPVEKLLLFRTTIDKNNPEGRSLLRGAYRSWYLKKNIENIEGIGIERDLAGLPMAFVPPELLSKNATAAQKNILSQIKNIVINVKRDEQEGLVFPMQYGADGKLLYDFKLLSTAGNRQFDTDKIITRYDHRILMALWSDFLLLGSKDAGSWALAKSKVDMMSMAVGAQLDVITDVYNNYAVPRLFKLNDFQVSEYPQIVHGDLGQKDLEVIGTYFKNLALSGMPIFPNQELEKELIEVAGFSPPTDPETIAEDMEIETPAQPEQRRGIKEIPPNPIQSPANTMEPADTTPVNGKPRTHAPITNLSGTAEQNSFSNNAQTTGESLRNQRKFE